MRWRRAFLLVALASGLAATTFGSNVGFAGPRRIVIAQRAQRVVPPPPLSPRTPAHLPRRRGPLRQPVEVRMMVIQASNSFQGYSRGIQHLRRHLSFLNYTGFRLLFQNEMMLRPGTTRRLGLIEGNTIEVTLNSATWEKAELRIRMYNTKQPTGVSLDTTVSVIRRGTFFVGGPRYQDGVLLLPITTWY